MRARDIVVAALAFAAIVGLWSQEGTVSVDFAFVTRMYSVGHHRYLPSPIVADIDGDGTNDLLVATHPDKIGFVQPHLLGAHVAVQLAPSKTASFYANVIGMVDGFLSFPNSTVHDAATKGHWYGGNSNKRHPFHGVPRHIAVVTDDYKLTLLNGTLDELWSVQIVEYERMNTVPRHASVLVLPDSVFEGDTVMIVVSVGTVSPTGAAETTVACFGGKTGELRWRHAPSSQTEQLEHEVALKFKFSDKDLAEHASSRKWTHFRDSVIASMPHRFAHPWDQHMAPTRFIHAKNSRKRPAHPKPLTDRPKEHHDARGLGHSEDHGELGQRYRSAVRGGTGGSRHQHVRPLPNVLAVHTASSIEFVHLFTGRVVTSLGPLRQDAVYDDLNDDLVLDQVTTTVGPVQEQFGRHGVDERFMCKGDISEGVPESPRSIVSSSVCDSEGYLSSLGVIRRIMRGDAGDQLASSFDPLERIGSQNLASRDTEMAVPSVVHLRRPFGRHIFKSQRLAVFLTSHGLVSATSAETGTTLWRSETPCSFAIRARDSHDAAFSTFAATSPEERSSQLHHFPHTAAFSFHDSSADAADVRSVAAARHRHHALILAVGSTHLALLNSLHGTIEATATVDRMPVAPTVIADLDGDGSNDLLITTPTGYHGYFVRRHSSGGVTAAVLVVAVGVVAVLYMIAYGSRFDLLGNTAGVEEAPESSGDELLGQDTGGTDSLRRRKVPKRSTD